MGQSPPKTRFFPSHLAVALAVVGGAIGLASELDIARHDLNDSVYHYTLADRLVQAIERGENPLDHWVSEWSLGYSVPRTYQMLAHLVVAGLYFALGKTVSVMTLFVWTRYLLLVLFPLSVYASARLVTLSRAAAAASAVVAPLLATPALYGLDYMSFTWRGSGLFTQALAMHLLALTLGLGYRAVVASGSLVLTGLALGLTFLAHFIYGYIGALSMLLLIATPAAVPRAVRIVRVAIIGAAAFAVAAFQLLPLVADGAYINHSRWEAAWKWDSYGATGVLMRLARGDLLDEGRFPVITLLTLAGVVVCLWRLRLPRGPSPDLARAPFAFVLMGALLWLALFAGRPTWGPLLPVMGVSPDLHLHRLIGAFQLFAIFLSGIALATLWSRCGRERPVATLAAVVVSAVILWPAVRERREFLRWNTTWGQDNLTAWQTDASDATRAIAMLSTTGGRVFPGLAASWGREFRVGSMPFYSLLSRAHVPALAFLYHSMSLTSDIMVHFDENNPVHYRLFGITAAISEAERPMPPFLTPTTRIGRFQLYDAPSTGYFDLVSVPYATTSDKHRFYDVNIKWLQSDWPARRQHLLLSVKDRVTPGVPRLGSFLPLPPAIDGPFQLGTISAAARQGERYDATVDVGDAAYLLFKMTYHPAWRARIDGEPAETVMLSPGFPGLALPRGSHQVSFAYEPGPLKPILLVLGLVALAALVLAERRGALERFQAVFAGHVVNTGRRVMAPRHAGIRTAAGLLLLTSPLVVSLLTSRLPAGHDTFEYFPRLIEFHENIRHGVLLPRWAPDLSSGFGQPLFLFSPPLLYFVAEAWLLVGFGPVTAMNLSAAVIVIGAAGSMFLLGRLLAGPTGGWLGAAAYVFAPYFLVDLHVRQALAEFAAFPFYPLALYGFTRHAREGGPEGLLIGSVAYAAVIWSHNAAALMFTPVLIVWIAGLARLRRSWTVLATEMGGVALGLGLSAAIWLPALAEMNATSVDRLLEGYLQYTNHFVYLHQLVWTNWGYGLSLPGYRDGMSFTLGWNLLALLAIVFWIGRRDLSESDRRTCRLMIAVGSAGCLLMLPGSLWFWDRLPLLRYVEFPWRLLTQTALCLAILMAFGGRILERRRRAPLAIAGALAVIIAPAIGHGRPSTYSGVDLMEWTPELIARRGVSVTTRNEYEPRGAQSGLAYRAERVSVRSGVATIGTLEATPTRWRVRVDAATDAVIQAAIFHFPGWTVGVDGQAMNALADDATGLIQIAVAPGSHDVELVFRRTPPRWIGEGLSLSALAIAVWLWRRRR